MHYSDKIYVAGHKGLVGSALVRKLSAMGYKNLVVREHDVLDLTNQSLVGNWFKEERPDYVFLAAAKVGGIMANFSLPAEFLSVNLSIALNVIDAAYKAGAKRLLFLGSSCIYPRDCSQAIREEYLLTGPLEPTNRAYAVAKIAGVELCWAYNRQYGCQYIAAMPANLYGPGDNYDLYSSHVIPALIRKMHEAQVRSPNSPAEATVELWGTGNPRREFLFSDDVADACVFLMNLPEDRYQSISNPGSPPLINIGFGADISIRELARTISEIVGFQGAIVWDYNQPDGTQRKLLDVSRLSQLGWRPKVDLVTGLRRTYQEYLQVEQERSVFAENLVHKDTV